MLIVQKVLVSVMRFFYCDQKLFNGIWSTRNKGELTITKNEEKSDKNFPLWVDDNFLDDYSETEKIFFIFYNLANGCRPWLEGFKVEQRNDGFPAEHRWVLVLKKNSWTIGNRYRVV